MLQAVIYGLGMFRGVGPAWDGLPKPEWLRNLGRLINSQTLQGKPLPSGFFVSGRQDRSCLPGQSWRAPPVGYGDWLPVGLPKSGDATLDQACLTLAELGVAVHRT